jgi:hypothetical protein
MCNDNTTKEGNSRKVSLSISSEKRWTDEHYPLRLCGRLLQETLPVKSSPSHFPFLLKGGMRVINHQNLPKSLNPWNLGYA